MEHSISSAVSTRCWSFLATAAELLQSQVAVAVSALAQKKDSFLGKLTGGSVAMMPQRGECSLQP
jgi:hypothetical protein